MTTPTTLSAILDRHDAGQDVPTISRALSVTRGWVYQILREHRPKRKRKPQTRVSETRRTIQGLAAQGIPAARIVFLMQEKCSRQYVYRELSKPAPIESDTRAELGNIAHDILTLHEKGMKPGAIATEVRRNRDFVHRTLKEAGIVF